MHIYLGIIGCGRHAQEHEKSLTSHFQVVTAWDPDPAMALRIPTDSPKAKSLEDLLASKDINTVMICSPEKFHLTQIEMALAAGKHVFCEKPLLVPGEKISRLKALFVLARQKGLVITSCHPRRYDRPILWLLEHMSPGEDRPSFPDRFGKPLHIAFDFSYHKPTSGWKHARSLLLDHANHEVDLMNALFGIQSIDAMQLYDGYDRYAIAGKRDDDITFHFQGTRRLDSKKYPEWCRIRFERGEVMIDMMMGLAYVIDHEAGTTEMVSGLTIDYKGRLSRVMDNFADQISGRHPGYLTESEMIMNTEVGIVLQKEGLQRIAV